MRNMYRVSVMIIVFLLLLPVTSALAAITPIGDGKYDVTDHRVSFSAGQSGTVTIGGGSFAPSQVGSGCFYDVKLKTSNTLNATNYFEVTFENGVTYKYDTVAGTPSNLSLMNDLMNNTSRSITIKFTADGDRDRWAELIYFETTNYCGGSTNPDPGDGGGTDPGGGGNTGGTPVNHNSFYKPWDDVYRLDFWGQPSSTNTIKLLFTSATGTVYEREWPASDVGGTLYLTCRGTYSVSYLDASGNQVGYINDLDTSSISNNVCTSYPEPNPINELNARVVNNGCTVDPSNPPKIVWDPIGSQYEIYRDGQLIDTVTGTEFPGDVPGSYTIIAKDQNGNSIGQSDVNMQFVTDNGDGTDNGADEICACIESLKPVLDEIRNNTQQIHQDLLETNQKLGVISGQLGDILDQITPERTYNVPSMPETPVLHKPPDIGSGKFEDNTRYFTDQGDAATPPPIPVAPEPSPWSHNGKQMNQQPEIQKSPNMKTDNPMVADPNMTKDQEMQKQPDMVKQPDMQKENDMERDDALERDIPLEVQHEEYPLRWKSSDYP